MRVRSLNEIVGCVTLSQWWDTQSRLHSCNCAVLLPHLNNLWLQEGKLWRVFNILYRNLAALPTYAPLDCPV